MKSKRFLSFLLAFILSFSVFSSPLTVQAGGGGSSREPEGEKVDRDKTAELIQHYGNFFSFVLSEFGVIINPLKWGDDQLRTNYYHFMAENNLIDSDELNFLDVITDHVYFSGDSDGSGGYLLNDNLKVSLDSEISDSIYAFAQDFVDVNTPKYRIIDTMDLRTVSATQYSTKDQWEKAKALLDAHPNDLVYMTKESGQILFYVVDCSDIAFFVRQQRDYLYGIFPYDNDWTTFPYTNWGYYTSWERVSKYIWNTSENNFTKAETCTFTPTGFVHMFTIGSYNTQGGTYLSPAQFSYKNGKAITVFDSREYAIQWLTGQRDVYTTSGFNNYQSGNSIRITGDNLSNSNNVYNVVNNTVNNYYGDDDKGVTDGDIQDIIDKAVADAIGSGSGSGGTVSGGDSSGGSSGGGLSGFLDGIGSVLDAILAIAGKLLEYVGKAIDLFSGTILKVIDIIPKGFTNFLVELFPFLPQEWFVAIELMLALSVVLIIINAFKK